MELVAMEAALNANAPDGFTDALFQDAVQSTEQRLWGVTATSMDGDDVVARSQ